MLFVKVLQNFFHSSVCWRFLLRLSWLFFRRILALDGLSQFFPVFWNQACLWFFSVTFLLASCCNFQAFVAHGNSPTIIVTLKSLTVLTFPTVRNRFIPSHTVNHQSFIRWEMMKKIQLNDFLKVLLGY